MPAADEWDRFDIVAAVGRAGSNFTKIALEAGLDGSACRAALVRPNLQGELAIARFLKRDPAQLWPERYSHAMSIARSSALDEFRASLRTNASPHPGENRRAS